MKLVLSDHGDPIRLTYLVHFYTDSCFFLLQSHGSLHFVIGRVDTLFDARDSSVDDSNDLRDQEQDCESNVDSWENESESRRFVVFEDTVCNDDCGKSEIGFSKCKDLEVKQLCWVESKQVKEEAEGLNN